MAEEGQDESSKTEEASQRKIDEARKKGQVISSREVNHFFMMLALTVFVLLLAPAMGRDTINLLAPLITQPDLIPADSEGIKSLFHHLLRGFGILMILPALLATIAAFAPAIVQRKWVFSSDLIQPKLERISPLAGFKRLLGLRAIVEFLRNLLKITLIAVAGVFAVWPTRESLLESLRTNNLDTLALSQRLSGDILTATVAILFLIALGDYMYQRFTFLKSLRMTKHEVKEEYKQQEGDPHIKQRVRQIRRERARKRMMANVPKADVIITNPTHYAIALQYDALTMPAPKLLAKGTDEVARRIRELAEKHKIPILRNPPLARVLYDTTDIDEEIPIEHYQAVAKIIGYVYKLKGKSLQRPSSKPGSVPKLTLRK